MINDFIAREMEELGVDGVEFIPIAFDSDPFADHPSFTKEQWKTELYIPKTTRLYWKILDDGDVKYIYSRDNFNKSDLSNLLYLLDNLMMYAPCICDRCVGHQNCEFGENRRYGESCAITDVIVAAKLYDMRGVFDSANEE